MVASSGTFENPPTGVPDQLADFHTSMEKTFQIHLNSDQNPGYRIFRDYNKPIYGSLLTNQYLGMSRTGFDRCSSDF